MGLREMRMGPSMVSTTLPTQPGGGGMSPEGLVIFALALSLVSNTYTINGTSIRVSIAAPVTLYLVARATFALGAISAFGTIRARRMR